jgi:hypothetical protein
MYDGWVLGKNHHFYDLISMKFGWILDYGNILRVFLLNCFTNLHGQNCKKIKLYK